MKQRIEKLTDSVKAVSLQQNKQSSLRNKKTPKILLVIVTVVVEDLKDHFMILSPVAILQM